MYFKGFIFSLVVATTACTSENMQTSANNFLEDNTVEDTLVVPNTHTFGGYVAEYAWKVQKANEQGLKVIFDEPFCHSACIYWLMANDLEVSPKTVFMFHSARSVPAMMVGIPVPVQSANLVIAEDLNNRWPGLDDEFLEKGADKLIFGHTWNQTGEELHQKYGVPLIKE